MKAPKCPKCGKGHFSTQRCSANEADTLEAVNRIITSPPASVAVPLAVVEAASSIYRQAMTSAEKQKAYRKRLKDDPKAREAYLEANKLRMRAKRKNDG